MIILDLEIVPINSDRFTLIKMKCLDLISKLKKLLEKIEVKNYWSEKLLERVKINEKIMT